MGCVLVSAVALLAGGCSLSGDEDSLPTSTVAVEQTTSTALPVTEPPLTANVVEPLWADVLSAFAAGADNRAAAFEALEGKIPDNAPGDADLLFGEEKLTFTSNPTFTLTSATTVDIADCVFSDIPTRVGAAAGFRATATLVDDEWTISELNLVGLCVPKIYAEPAEAAYLRYIEELAGFWADYTTDTNLDDPRLYVGLTAGQAERHRASLDTIRNNDLIQVFDVDARFVEPAGSQLLDDGRIVVFFSQCVHLGPNGGVHRLLQNGELEPFDPDYDGGQFLGRFVMILDGDNWLFDGFSPPAEEAPCLTGPSDRGSAVL